MSIRKISELPQVKFAELMAGRGSSEYKTDEALLEVSWSINDSDTQFASKYVKCNDLSNIITYNIYNEASTFGGKKTFVGDVDIRSANKFYIDTPKTEIDSPIISANVERLTENVSGLKRSIVEDVISVDIDNNGLFVKLDREAGLKVSQNTSTILSVDTFGKFHFINDIEGTAVKAKWADLAEYYESDAKYPEGTLIRFAGDKEITIANFDEVNAVVSTKPGFVLNGEDAKDGVIKLPIALLGRVPVRVLGKIKKFDKIKLSKKPGVAERFNRVISDSNIIGVALESSDDDGEKLIMCSVRLDF